MFAALDLAALDLAKPDRIALACAMTPIFTIHAGEYLVGSCLEKHHKHIRVWIPSKDDGLDLLLTSRACLEGISVQVKFSKDWKEIIKSQQVHRLVQSSSWIRINRRKLEATEAAWWVLVIYGFDRLKADFVVIKPSVLLAQLNEIHGRKVGIFSLYLTVTKQGLVFEHRKLGENSLLDTNKLRHTKYDFSDCLDPNLNGLAARIARAAD